MYLKQSTEITTPIGPFLDVGDGVTEEIGLAGNGTEISKNGGAFGAGPVLGTHDAEGWYPITLSTTHTNTVGRLVVKSHDSATHLPVWHEFWVLEEAIYDALFAGSATGALPVSAGGIAAASFAADVDAEILSYLVDDATRIDASALNTASTAVGSNGSGLTEAGGDGDHLTAINLPNQTMDITGNITGNLSGSVGSVTGAVGSVTGNVGGIAGTIQTLDALDTAQDAQHATTQAMLRGLVLAQGTIGATGNDATHLHLDGLAYGDDGPNEHAIVLFDNSANLYYTCWISDFATTGDLATITPALPVTPEASVDTYWLLSIRRDVSATANVDLAAFFTSDSGETYASAVAGSVVKEIADNAGGSALTVEAIADAVLDEALSGHVSAGTLGKAIADIEADTSELQTDWVDGGRLDLILDELTTQGDANEAKIDTVDGIVDTIKLNTDYPDGYVYLDATNGASGTTVGTNGTLANPSDTFANAATIAASLGHKKIKLIGSGGLVSSGTFSAYHVDLNGHGIIFNQAVIFDSSSKLFSSGATGTISPDQGGFQDTNDVDPATYWENLSFQGSVRVATYAYFRRCAFGVSNGITFTVQGDNGVDPVYLEDCYSGKASGLTFNCSGGADLIMSGWYGDFTITNLAAGTTVQVYGWGKVTLDSSCTGGTIRYTSHIEVTDNASGAVTQDLVSEPGGVSSFTTAAKAEIEQEVTDALTAYNAVSTSNLPANFADLAISVTTGRVTVGTNADKTGYALASTGLDAVTVWTVDITGSLSGSVGSVTGNVGGNLVGSVGSLSATAIANVWTTALTEAYAADGAAFTGAQALYEICQSMTEFIISGSTITVRKRDGSTTALSYTLDSSDSPTSRTRAT